MIKSIPNTLTLCNLICGCLGIVCSFNGMLEWSGYLIGIAAIFDFFDGFAARLLDAKSPIGGQLDSLADMVTFGVLPSMILFQLLSISFNEYFIPFSERPFNHIAIESLAFLVAAFSALRLAKFNIDETQTDSFVGMPTPSIAILIGSLPLVLSNLKFNYYTFLSPDQISDVAKTLYWSSFKSGLVMMLQSKIFLIALTVLCSAMLVAPIRMIALKFKGFSWEKNKTIYGFLFFIFFIGLLTLRPYLFYVSWLPELDFLSIPIIILVYPLYSVLMVNKQH